MDEPHVVSPQAAKDLGRFLHEWGEPSNTWTACLAHTVATEEERIRAAVVEALRSAADDANVVDADGPRHLNGVDHALRQRAKLIAGGGNW